MTGASTTQQIHQFLVSRIGMMFEELSVQSGLQIPYNSRNIEHIAKSIEDYMFPQLQDSWS